MALPDHFRRLKARLWKGLARGPELLQQFSCSLLPPSQHDGHSFIGMSRWFCLCLCLWVRQSWDKKCELNTAHVPIPLGEDKAEEDLCLTGWLVVPSTVPRIFVHMVQCITAGLGAFPFIEEPLGRSLEEERSQATETCHLWMQIILAFFVSYVSYPPLS